VWLSFPGASPQHWSVQMIYQTSNDVHKSMKKDAVKHPFFYCVLFNNWDKNK